MSLLNLPLLLAQRSAVMHLGDRFRSGQAGGDGRVLVLILLVTAAALVVAWLIVPWLIRRQHEARNSPKRLFNDLCRAHRLSRRQRQILWRVAQLQKLSQPAVLFLEPQHWEMPQRASLEPEAAAELELLKQHLFRPL